MSTCALPEWVVTLQVEHNPTFLKDHFRKGDFLSLEELMRAKAGELTMAVAQRLWLALLHLAAEAHRTGRVLGDLALQDFWVQDSSQTPFFSLKTIAEFDPPAPPPPPPDWAKHGPAEIVDAESPSQDLFNIASLILRLLVGDDSFANESEMFSVLDRVRLLRPDLTEELLLLLFRHLEREPTLRPGDALQEIELFASLERELQETGWLPFTGLFWGNSDAGVAKRRMAAKSYTYPDKIEINQDTFIARQLAKNLYLLGVFDGVSTCTLGSGGQAATITQDVFEDQSFDQAAFESLPTEADRLEFLQQWLQGAFEAANVRIAEATQNIYVSAKEQKRPVDTTHTMLTTATVALVSGNRFLLGWVGDSPAFLLHRQFCMPLTFPHDRVTEMLKEKRPIIETFSVERDSAVTEYLGGVFFPKDHLEKDSNVTVRELRPDYVNGVLPENSILMLASDGILDQRSSLSFLSLLKQLFSEAMAANCTDPVQQLESLFGLLWSGANHKQQQDNITLLLHLAQPSPLQNSIEERDPLSTKARS